MLGGLLRLLLLPFRLVGALGGLLLRLAAVAIVAAFVLGLAGEVADAQTFAGVAPWDRPDEPLDEPATGSSTEEEPEETGACSGLMPAPMMAGCAVIRGTEAAGNALEAAATNALESMMLAVNDGAVWFLGKVAAFLDASTPPALDAPWFTGQYDTMVALAAIVVLPLVLVAIIDAVVHGRPGEILRALLLYLPLAGVVTVVAVELVDIALDITDWASLAVSGTVAADTAGFLEQIGQTLAQHDTALPVFALFIGGLFTLFGALVLWIELLLRTAGIHIAVLFLPLAFATMVWPRIARWASRALRTLAALTVSKFFIIAVISLGASLLGSITEAPTSTPTAGMRDAAVVSGGLETVVAGIALLSLACFAPWVLWRLLAPVEGAMDAALEGATRRPTAAAGHPHLRDVKGLASGLHVGHRSTDAAPRQLPVAGVTAASAGAGGSPRAEEAQPATSGTSPPRPDARTTAKTPAERTAQADGATPAADDAEGGPSARGTSEAAGAAPGRSASAAMGSAGGGPDPVPPAPQAQVPPAPRAQGAPAAAPPPPPPPDGSRTVPPPPRPPASQE